MPRSIAASLIVVYSAGARRVPKGNLKQIKASLSTIAMHGDAVFACSCIRQYSTSRSVVPIRIRFVVHLLRIA